MKERFKKIVTNLIFKQPFFGYPALNLNFCEARNIPGVGTDAKGNFYYNPDYISKVSDKDLEIMIAHAVLHLVLRHLARMKGRDRFLWNISIDIETNYILYQIYERLPTSFLVFYGFDPRAGKAIVFGRDNIFGEMSAERIYNVLQKMKEVEIKCEGSLDSKWKVLEVKENSECKQREKKGGKEKFFKKSKEGQGPAGHDVHMGGGHEDEDKGEDEKWKTMLTQAYHHAKTIGKIPGKLEELITKLLYPKLPWNVILRRYVSDIAKDAFNWYPPNRRYIYRDLYLPSLYSPCLKIAIAIDTSGSISSKELKAFLAEINAIISSFTSYSILLIQCDAQIQSEMEISTGEFLPQSLNIKGRAGTDFRPVFERLEEETEIKALIYLTDGLGKYPEKPPPYPVLWVLSKSGYNVKPPFGTSIWIEVE